MGFTITFGSKSNDKKREKGIKKGKEEEKERKKRMEEKKRKKWANT